MFQSASALLHALPPANVTVDASRPLWPVRAVHGVCEGPVIEADWLANMPRQKISHDETGGFKRSAVPAVRTHGTGCVDMDRLWKPYPSYRGMNASDPSNYNWTIADACLGNVFANPALPPFTASIRLGHSRAMRAEHPHFCEGPDDVNVFANISAAIVRRYLDVKGWPVRDFTVWNEPGNPYEGSDSPFWCRPAGDFATLYRATYARLSSEFGSRIRVGLPLALNNFSTDLLRMLRGNGSSFDFVDHHVYAPAPSVIMWQVFARPERNLEKEIAAAGFPASTPINIGEWSRSIGLGYAQDPPGAAFLTCGLIYLNALGQAGDGAFGTHHVEQAYVFAAEKVWDGRTPGAPDLNAGRVWQAWSQMVGLAEVATSGGRYPAGVDPAHSGDDLCILAAGGAGANELTVLVSHYKADGTSQRPTTLPAFPLNLALHGLPWPVWKWEQWGDVQQGSLRMLASGQQNGTQAALHLEMSGNAFTVLNIGPP
jgi:hypothetical protein